MRVCREMRKPLSGWEGSQPAMIDRDAVLNNAKYLRQVRPIDPEEITDYITGTPHPAVIREILREEAYALKIREQADGTFVPVSQKPLERPSWQPEAFPQPYADTIEDLLIEQFGLQWAAGETGAGLRSAIRSLKSQYLEGDSVSYDYQTALGYAIYHLPTYYASIGYVLDDLAMNDWLSRSLRILDIGAGTGGPGLGIADYFPSDSIVEYHAVEPISAAGRVMDAFESELGKNVRVHRHQTTAETFTPECETFDLILFANVLSELTDPRAVIEQSLSWVANDGAVILTAPADKRTSIQLRTLERAVVETRDALSVYSPTIRLWPDAEPNDRGWSFDRRQPIQPPAVQRQLDTVSDTDRDTETDAPGDGTFVKTSVKFSYAILRPDGATRSDIRANSQRHAKMAKMNTHVTHRIDLIAVKLSENLTPTPQRADSANPLYKIGDGSQHVDHYAVLTVEDPLTSALERAAYGRILAFENVLCLWNDDEDAYNLVVDAESVVEILE